MPVVQAVGHAFETAASMAWEILWALVLGFYLPVVEALVHKDTIGRLLGNHRPKSPAVAAGFGAPRRRRVVTRRPPWPVR